MSSYSPFESDNIARQYSFDHDLQNTLQHDRVVGIHAGQKLYLSQILNFVFNDRISFVASKSKYQPSGLSNVQPGWVHLGKNKQDLALQKETKWVRSVSTILKHVHSGYEYMTYGTFNITHKRSHYERRKASLNSSQAFVVDIDRSDISIQEIIHRCNAIGLYEPSFINATPRGYHLWWVFNKQSEAIGPHIRDGQLTKTGSYYNDLNKFIVHKLNESFSSERENDVVDNLFGGERYIRIPLNIVFYRGTKYDLKDFQAFRDQYVKEEAEQKNPNINEHSKNHNATKKPGKYLPRTAIYGDPAFRKLLSNKPKKGLRRYTALTISLLYKELALDKSECVQALKNWYYKVCNAPKDFPWNEVEREVNSAYSGPWRLSVSWVKTLTGIYPKRYTRKKRKEERLYGTLDDRCQQFIEKLKENNGVWKVSNRAAMAELGIESKNNLSRIVDKLISNNVIEKEVIGKGRAAFTVYRLIKNPEKPKKTPSGKITYIGDSFHFKMPQICISNYKSMTGRVGGLNLYPGTHVNNYMILLNLCMCSFFEKD
ncbi:hypothetical protein ACR6EC_22340 [Bacillus subtilis]|uniref:hypothetical protein n=1 Tax=Bacillus subtilis TaxID=1423 RepID=UPI003EB97043